MTKEEAHDILHYIARNIISPLCHDQTPARDVYLRLSGEDFNALCKFVYNMVTE